MIPAILNFVWIGGRPLPPWAERNLAEFHRLNPGHEIRIHDEAALLPEYRAAFDAAAADLPQRADLLRYSALQRYGGWYFDLDYFPLRPIADIERAFALDGSRLFVSRQANNINPAWTHANSPLASGPNCRAWPWINSYIARQQLPAPHVQFGPAMIKELAKRQPRSIVASDAAWFFPAPAGQATLLYEDALARGAEVVRSQAVGTGGQLPFALHLWANGKDDLPRPKMRLGSEIVAPFGECIGAAGVILPERAKVVPDHPMTRIAHGLSRIGYRVETVMDGSFREWPIFSVAPDVLAVWTGRREPDSKIVATAEAAGITVLRAEHGFFDRTKNFHVDHEGILHWASWCRKLRGPAPAGGAARLASVWPKPIEPARVLKTGYVLVIGQMDGDTQMQDSAISEALPLEKIVMRSLPKGIDARFRPHPKGLRGYQMRRHYLPLCEAETLEAALAGARFVVTINSNTGVEAIAQGVPVLAFGPATYLTAGVAKQATEATIMADLKAMLDGWHHDDAAARQYLAHLAARQYSLNELGAGECLRSILAEVANV